MEQGSARDEGAELPPAAPGSSPEHSLQLPELQKETRTISPFPRTPERETRRISPFPRTPEGKPVQSLLFPELQKEKPGESLPFPALHSSQKLVLEGFGALASSGGKEPGKEGNEIILHQAQDAKLSQDPAQSHPQSVWGSVPGCDTERGIHVPRLGVATLVSAGKGRMEHPKELEMNTGNSGMLGVLGVMEMLKTLGMVEMMEVLGMLKFWKSWRCWEYWECWKYWEYWKCWEC